MPNMTSTLRADKIGSLLFCPDCGTLLDLPQKAESIVTCEQCSHEEPADSYLDIEITTRSRPSAFPSVLRQKLRSTRTKDHSGEEARLKVTEKCPDCGHMEAYSKEMQLRSADEGSTILYECVECKFGWRVNN